MKLAVVSGLSRLPEFAKQRVYAVLQSNDFTKRIPTIDCHNLLPPDESQNSIMGAGVESEPLNQSDEIIALMIHKI